MVISIKEFMEFDESFLIMIMIMIVIMIMIMIMEMLSIDEHHHHQDGAAKRAWAREVVH